MVKGEVTAHIGISLEELQARIEAAKAEEEARRAAHHGEGDQGPGIRMTDTLLALVPTYGVWLSLLALPLSCLALPVPSSIGTPKMPSWKQGG